jgi:hypothetical protein
MMIDDSHVCVTKQTTRPIRNQEASVTEAQLAWLPNAGPGPAEQMETR